MQRDQYVVIVDAFSTGGYLAATFQKEGVQAIHVLSNSSFPPGTLETFKPADFVETWSLKTHDLSDILLSLQNKPIIGVIAGAETGVITADILAHCLQLPGNNPQTSFLRRDKWYMQDALRAAHLASIAEIATADVKEAISWARDKKTGVVVKPRDSAGSEHVYFCQSPEDIEEAFRQSLHHPNALGGSNQTLLVQERLQGEQYTINTVSVHGEHFICEIWRDRRRTYRHSGLYDREDSIAYTQVDPRMITYIKQVLTCLHVQEGPAHSELMLTPNGPVLIETGARLQGSSLPEASTVAFGSSHLQNAVDAMLYPETFTRNKSGGYALQQPVTCVTLSSLRSGVIQKSFLFEKVSRLVSFFAIFHVAIPGQQVYETVDLFTSIGSVYLSHPNQSVIDGDYQQIKEWEMKGELFLIE